MVFDSDNTTKKVVTFTLIAPLVPTLPIALLIALAGSMSNKKTDALFGIPILLIGYPIGLAPSFIASCTHFWILSKLSNGASALSKFRLFLSGASSGAFGILLSASILVLITGESKAPTVILQKLMPLGIFSGGICALIVEKITSRRGKDNQAT